MLSIRGLNKTFHRGRPDECTLFSQFDLEVAAGSFVSIVGGNGSGKTSLLNMICGTLRQDGGSITLDGENITKKSSYLRHQHIGMVRQNPAGGTCPSLTVAENLALFEAKGKRFGLQRGVDKRRLEAYRDQLRGLEVGLEDALDRQVGQLSGGQRQALALVMASRMPLKLLLLDEHTAALDPKTAVRIMELTQTMVTTHKLTTLMVTHNLSMAEQYGDRLLMLEHGRIVLDASGEAKQQLDQQTLIQRFYRADNAQ